MSLSAEQIGIAVIGCGHWGPNHIRNFSSHPRASVRYCVDIDPKRLQNVNDQFPQVQATGDFQQVLADPAVHAVIIATPTGTHYTLAKKALNAGKHVLCEKPLTTISAAATELAILAKEKNRILMVGHVFLFNPGIRKLGELIAAGEVGSVYYLHATRTNLGPIRQDVDCIWDLATHDISIFNFLLGSQPKSVSACGCHYLQDGKADVAFITLSYPGQVLANIHVSWLDPKKVRQLTVVGDRKMVTWDDMQAGTPITIYDKGIVREPFYHDFGEFQLVTKEGDIVMPKVRSAEPMRLQTDYFLSGIQRGSLDVCTAAEGVAVVQVLEAITQSLATGGAPVKLQA